MPRWVSVVNQSFCMKITLWKLAAVTAVAVSLYLVWVKPRGISSKRGASGPPVAGQSAAMDTVMAQHFLDLERQDQRLDATVWAKEILAEQYEEYFIQLWDELRGSQDRFAILKRYAFGNLLLGLPGAATRHGHEIRVIKQQPLVQSRSPEEWVTLLERWRREGYTIEQTEWRHRQFDPGTPERDPQSIFSVIGHIVNTQRQQRVILRGNLRVTWSRSTSAAGLGQARPQTIDAGGIEAVLRQPEVQIAVRIDVSRAKNLDIPEAFRRHPDSFSALGIRSILIPAVKH